MGSQRLAVSLKEREEFCSKNLPGIELPYRGSANARRSMRQVDHRRKNRCTESLQENAARLKLYKTKLMAPRALRSVWGVLRGSAVPGFQIASPA